MRRKDREVKDSAEIYAMLAKCDTLRIGMAVENQAYVVPVSFGCTQQDGKAVIYFHCAQEGLKLDFLKKNPKVCVEGDIFHKVEPTAHGITTRYESVIGFGQCVFIEEEKEILAGMNCLLAHYGYHDYPLTRCKGLAHLKLGKIILDQLTGKRNLSDCQGA